MIRCNSLEEVSARSLTRRALLSAGIAAALVEPAQAAERIRFPDLLSEQGDFTAKARALSGLPVEMRGYMAPPLKPEISFFVLTALPATVCPFCDSAASWPDDIVLIETARPIRAIAYDLLVQVSGILEIGTQTDPATGFVSRVRIGQARYVRA